VNSITVSDSPLQKAARAAFEEDMKRKLASKPGLSEKSKCAYMRHIQLLSVMMQSYPNLRSAVDV